MTYFHINLDPRGKKKSFAANSYTRDYIRFVRLFLWVIFVFLFFSERAFKDKSSGRIMGDHSAFRGPRVPPPGYGFRLRRPADSPLRVGFRLLLPVQ